MKSESGQTNTALSRARVAKNDEFYTQRESIEAELKHYRRHFDGKVVYCNCDDPTISEFYLFFKNNFRELGLKKLLTTCYKNNKADLWSQNKDAKSVRVVYDGKEEITKWLKGDGDFRSDECIELLRQADIVVSNPPFSLFREYVQQLVVKNKKFIIIGSKNAIHYKDVFPLIVANELWAGYTPMSYDMLFHLPLDFANELVKTKKEGSAYKIVNGVVMGRSTSIWYTNLDHAKRHKDLIITARYKDDKSVYPNYDNYDAINVNRVVDIPCDYAEVMGVPDTFLDKWNPKQFDILGMLGNGRVNGVAKYSRLLIKNRRVQ